MGILHPLPLFLSYILDRQGPKGALCIHKQWSTVPVPYPYQVTIMDIAAHAPEYREEGLTLPELFPPKSQCFVMAPPHYGSLAEVRWLFPELQEGEMCPYQLSNISVKRNGG